MLPNFIIAGAEKSGTSSLVFYLSEHDSIYIPSVKEIYFFNNEENFKRGVEWYEKWFSGWSGERAVGECTPLYMYDPTCSGKIHRMFPEMKLIFILRNPIDRAYSNYWHQIRGGKEFHTFEKSLEKKRKPIGKTKFYNRPYAYLDKGCYYLQLRRFTEKFTRDQMYVVIFDDLIDYPQKVLDKICSFLEVEPKKDYKSINVIKNKTSLPKSKYLQYAARKLFGTSFIFKAISKINIGYEDYPRMDIETRKDLISFFSDDIDKLSTLTGLDFNLWKAPL
jgi:hypothetical protein